MSGNPPRVSGSRTPVNLPAPSEHLQRSETPPTDGPVMASRASVARESPASMAQRRTDIRSFSSSTCGAPPAGDFPAATALHRLTVRERVPQLGPVGIELAASCLAVFEHRGGASLPSQDSGRATSLNKLAGEVVYEMLRKHFKGGLKSSNWRYAEDGPATAERRQRREHKAQQSGELLHQLDARGAPLEDYLERRVGNCQVHAAAATALARALGVKANIWHFIDAEDEEDDEGDLLASHTHALCIIGEVPSLQDPQRPAGKYERTGDLDADHLYAVDTWSGLQGPSKTLREDYRQAMKDKSEAGKLIAIEVEGDETANPEEPVEKLLSPAGKEWLQMTADSGFTLRKDIEPDAKYRPE